MDRDRKSTALKSLQGRIWEAGYRVGRAASRTSTRTCGRPSSAGRAAGPNGRDLLLGQRARPAPAVRAHAGGGPHAADRRLLRHHHRAQARAGELPADRRRAAVAPAAVLFVSDVAAELDAARAAGLPDGAVRPRRGRPRPPTIRCVRASKSSVATRSGPVRPGAAPRRSRGRPRGCGRPRSGRAWSCWQMVPTSCSVSRPVRMESFSSDSVISLRTFS